MRTQIEQFKMDMGIENMEDIASLFQDYLTESLDLVQQISDTVQNGSTVDARALEKIVHNLKGVSANLYVETVYQDASLVDDYLKHSQSLLPVSQEFNRLWDKLRDSYEEARKQIIQYFEDYGYHFTQ